MAVSDQKLTERDRKLLREAAAEGRKARAAGNHPFGAVLTDGEGKIILRAQNTVSTAHNDCGHAETNLMIAASQKYCREFLEECSLYTSVEPCAMCAGAVYWANVRRVVYGISEHQLLELTGDDPENQTFDLPCREVFERGQKDICVAGPTEDESLRNLIAEDHKGFWQNS